jgi:hypothetical protein
MIIAAQAIQAAVFVEGGSRNSNESRLSDMAKHNLKHNLLYILSIYIYNNNNTLNDMITNMYIYNVPPYFS